MCETTASTGIVLLRAALAHIDQLDSEQRLLLICAHDLLWEMNDLNVRQLSASYKSVSITLITFIRHFSAPFPSQPP